jgi:rubrerythrin
MKIEERNGQLVIVDFNEYEAYRIACKIEKDGLGLYQKLHDAASLVQVKETMNFLIAEEKKHLAYFEGALNSLRKLREEEDEDNDLLQNIDFAVFQPYQSMEKLGDALDDFRKAVRMGVIIEDKSIAFYERCKAAVSSLVSKKHLQSIVEEEKRHKELLQKMIT